MLNPKSGVLFAAARLACTLHAEYDGVRNNFPHRGGSWKVVYSSVQGPEGRALEVLTERIGRNFLRDSHRSTPLMLPLEKDGGAPVQGKPNRIVLGVPSQNATLKTLLGATDAARVPVGGYLIKTFHSKDGNVVLIAGDRPAAVLWGVFDFLDVTVPTLEARMVGQQDRYVGTFFRAARIPDHTTVGAPETPVRSVWAWGYVLDDYRSAFRAMARARMNRVILWNNRPVVNAADVVACAHSWGIEVYWGFSWGWTFSIMKGNNLDFNRLTDGIVEQWRTLWKPMGGDGIYFQSFTETSRKTIGGRPLPEAVTELVNTTAKRIRAEAPGLKIIFGLHATSVKSDVGTAAIAKVDPTLEILWEDCGGFPFNDGYDRVSRPDTAFCERVLDLTPTAGFCWKAQLRLDWGDFVSPAGPFMLGCAGPKLLARDIETAEYRHFALDEDWVVNGRSVWEHVRKLRARKGRKPFEFSAVAEYNPPYSFATICQAELFWNTQDSWETILKRVRLKMRPEW
jgi:hypothetical protein